MSIKLILLLSFFTLFTAAGGNAVGASKVIHVVTGAHQDLAFQETHQKSLDTYDEQLRKHIEMIETDPDLRFSMGNTYNIKGFLERYPDYRPRLRYLMETGKISSPAQWVGGEPEWYTGEFLARYVAYSKYWLMSEMNHTTHWGQLNDMMSWTPQFAQILNKSGVDLIQINPSRLGHYYLPQDQPSYLVGLDGSRVIAFNTEYDGLINFSDQDKIQPLKYKKNFGPYKHILMSVIGDTGTEPDRTGRLVENIKWWNRKMASKQGIKLELNTYEEATRAIKKELSGPGVKPGNYSGLAYIWPWAAWNVPSMFYHAQTEYQLPVAESLFAVLDRLKIARYPGKKLDQAWEGIFWTIDHNWGKDDKPRGKSNLESYQISNLLLNQGLTLLGENVKASKSGIPLLVYNPLNWERTGPVEINIPFPANKRKEVVDFRGNPVPYQWVTAFKELVMDHKGRCRVDPRQGREKIKRLLIWAEKIPGLGYKRYYLRPKSRRTVSNPLKISKRSVENRFFSIKFDPRSKLLSIYDKQTGRELTKPGTHLGLGKLNTYHWTLDGAKKGKLRSPMKILKAGCIEQGPVRATMEVEGMVADVVKIIQRFQLYRDSNTLVHEISMEIPLGKKINVKQALYYILNIGKQFRPTLGVPYGAVPLIPQGDRSVKIKLSRRSPNRSFKFGRRKRRPFKGEIHDLQKWISYCRGDHSIDLLTGRTQTRAYLKNGLAALEIQPMLTGLPKVWKFGLYSHAGDWRAGKTPRKAWELASPLLGIATREGKPGRNLPEEAHFMEVTATGKTGNIIVSALKRSFDGKGIVLRFFETHDKDVTVSIKPNPVFRIPQAEVSRVNMVEQPKMPLKKNSSGYYLPVKGFGIETVKFFPEKVTDQDPPGKIKDFEVTQTSSTGVELAWTASGDDFYQGKAAAYELRYLRSPINNRNWEKGVTVENLPSPKPAGAKEQVSVKGLKSNKTYYFAIKAADESHNRSILSKTVSAATQTRDYIKPGRVVDLGVAGKGSTSVKLYWTASGDDGRKGRADRYQVLYSREMIDDTTWKRKAVTAPGEIKPKTSGKQERFLITGLQPDSKYYFSLISYDEAGNHSPLSNITFSRTDQTTSQAFQNGVAPTPSYFGCLDTYLSNINEEESAISYGNEYTLQTYSNNISLVLIRFDLSEIPGDAIVFKGVLKLYGYDVTYEDSGYLTCYRMKTGWSEEKATWRTSNGEFPWKNGIENHIDKSTDYGLLPRGVIARAKVKDGKHWVELDITPLVKDWVSGKQPNYGVLLKGNCPGDCGMYFHASEYEDDVKLHPRLEVSY